MSLLLLAACGTGIFSSERDRAPATDSVAWSGYLFRTPDAIEENLLSTGAPGVEEACADVAECPAVVTFTLPDGTTVEGAELYADYPGYWTATLPANTSFSLRISGEGLVPAVWDGATGDRDATWFSGALFGVDEAWFAAYLEALGDPGIVASDTVAVWGYPADPDAWSCAEIRVSGEMPTCYVTDDLGITVVTEEGPVTSFLAFGLPPGEVSVESGDGAAHGYRAVGGDLVMAFWFLGYVP